MKIRLIWIVLAGAIFLLVSIILVPSDSEYVRLAIDGGDYDYASALLKPFLRSPAPPLWALRDAAKVSVFQGYPQRATRYLEALLKKDPLKYQDRLELARLYLDLYQPHKAADELHTLLESDKLPVKDMLNLAKSYDIMNLSSSALEILHKVADSHPKDMSYWKAILIYDSQTGNNSDMSRTLRTLTRHFPDRVDYLMLRMNLAYRQGRSREVMRMMSRIRNLDGRLDTLLMPSIRSLFRLNRPVDAYLLYRQLSPNIADKSVLDTAAWFFYRKKYNGYALSIFEDLATREPNDREIWDNAIWLSDKMGWFERTRMLMFSRQNGQPLPTVRFHERLLDLDHRYHLKGWAQRDLLTWLGAPGGPSLSDLKLAWQDSENENAFPLSVARLKQAIALYPGRDFLKSDLAWNYTEMDMPDNAGGVILALGLAKKDRALVRSSLAYFKDADHSEAIKGIYFRLASSDSKEEFRKDQFALFELFEASRHKTGASHLMAILKRFPDQSATVSLELARILIWRKRYEDATRIIDRVAITYPSNRAVLFQASDWFIEADQVPRALVYDKMLVDLSPRDPEGLALWIRHKRWAGKKQQILVYYQRLLRLQPGNSQALLYLGDYAYSHGQFRQAIGYYRRAVKSGVIDYQVFYHLGQSFRQVNDERRARKMFGLARQMLDREREFRKIDRKQDSGIFRKASWVLVSAVDPVSPPDSNKSRRERLLYSIKILSAMGHQREAYRKTLQFLQEFPGDRAGLFLAASLLRKQGKPGQSLGFVNSWLRLHPQDKNFLVFKAETLADIGRLHAAQALLWDLHRRYPKDKVIWNDLIDSYRRSGRLQDTSSFDSHIFSQGETTAPRVSSGLLTLFDMNQWSLRNQDFGIFYPGGAAYIFDTKIETPLYNNVNYFAGRTEYLGVGAATGWGNNDFTYAGLRWTPAPGWQVVGEAGDTRLTNSPGLYMHLSGNVSRISIDVQGFDNMIWGDFGESIVRNGLQSGYMAQATWTVFSRLSLVAESWLFDYTLENGTLPFGTLHNTMGMADFVLNEFPQLDLVGGYEDWSLMSPSQAVASLVPILERQQFFFSALVYQYQTRNRMRFNAQVGGYEDVYSHKPSYEGGAGVSYRFSEHVEGFASGDYFNQSVLYNGSSQEVVWGFNLWF